MTLGDKLAKLRRKHDYTQEQLAEVLGVSRQAISKWESNAAYPETDKLIRISELFDCSLDYLLKDAVETNDATEPEPFVPPVPQRAKERKSDRMLWGMPLWHIARNARGVIAVGINARGLLAIGVRARGVVSLGVVSMGIFSLGTVSFGVLSLGMIAFGLLAAGAISAGLIAAGAICHGVVSLGAIAKGDFAVGALAFGKYFALGDRAQAMIALGNTDATGSVFQTVRDLTAEDGAAVRRLLDRLVPDYLNWAKEMVKAFLP